MEMKSLLCIYLVYLVVHTATYNRKYFSPWLWCDSVLVIDTIRYTLYLGMTCTFDESDLILVWHNFPCLGVKYRTGNYDRSWLVNSILSPQFCNVKDEWSDIYVQTCTWYLHFLWILIDLFCRHLLFSPKMEWKNWPVVAAVQSQFDRQICLHCVKVHVSWLVWGTLKSLRVLWYRPREHTNSTIREVEAEKNLVFFIFVYNFGEFIELTELPDSCSDI